VTALVPRPSLATPAAPFLPHTLDGLLRRQPERAAAVLAALRPALRRAQLAVQAELAEPLRRYLDDRDAPLPSAPIAPETLALLEPDAAQAAVAALSPTQRIRQAVAQAHWLADFGYPVAFEDLLAAWAAGMPRMQALRPAPAQGLPPLDPARVAPPPEPPNVMLPSAHRPLLRPYAGAGEAVPSLSPVSGSGIVA
jgi:hypothetical protein